MKKILSVILTVCVLTTAFITGVQFAAAAETKGQKRLADYVSVTDCDSDVDYCQRILDCLEDGSEYAMELGALYEKIRNYKIESNDMPYEQTHYFDTYGTADEIIGKMTGNVVSGNVSSPAPEEAPEPEPAPTYTDAELDLLSRIIYAEAGCTWMPDWVQRAVGSVVLNRVASSAYPNTIYDVVYQPGQYSPVWDGSINKTPDQRTIDNARYLLENGSELPAGVIGQSSVPYGAVHSTYYDSVLDTTIYFFYG